MLSFTSLGESSVAVALRQNNNIPEQTLDQPELPVAAMHRSAARYVGRARSFPELLAAYRLVYNCYVQRGYVAPSEERIRVTFHNLLPSTATFVLSRRKTVARGNGDSARNDHCQLLGTVSVAIDSKKHGLPLADTFPEQLRRLRNRERRVAEAIMLAHRPDGAQHSVSGEFEQLLMLLRCVTDYARLFKIDDLCIQTNPHHVKFYKRKLAFEVVDGPRPCPSVRGAPAVLLHHDMHTIRERSEALVPRASRFFLSRSPDESIREGGYRLTGNDILKLLSLKPGLWRTGATGVSACDDFVQAYPDLAPGSGGEDPSVVPFPPIPREVLAAAARREAVA